MPIVNDLNDIVEASGDMLARLLLPTIFPTMDYCRCRPGLKGHYPPTPLLLDMVLWLVVGMAFFRNEPISEVAPGALNICRRGWPMMPCSRTVPVSGPSATRQTAARWLFKQCADVWAGTLS